MRTLLLWAARNEWLRARVPRLRFVRRAVRRFLPGERLDDALAAAERLRAEGMATVFTFLGENVTDLAATNAVAEHYHEVLDRVVERGLDTEISLKLTHLGLDIDPSAAAASLAQLAGHAARAGTWVWIDMEGSAYTERTVALFAELRPAQPNLGLCLQAYLRRTAGDVARLLPLEPAIRLVKGAYDEPSEIAHRGARAVDEAFIETGQALLRARRSGAVPRFVAATHDVALIERLAADAEAMGLGPSAVEVQMLYGIRADEQRRLLASGYEVRTLIAYGEAWYAWYLRRLAERPANLFFAMRQLLP